MMDPVVMRELLRGDASPMHREMLQTCVARIDASAQYWGARHPRYRESERLYRVFRVADEEDEATREKPLTEGVEKLVIPFGYATLQSMLAFCMLTLTGRDPIIPVQGVGGKDVRAGLLMEAVLGYQASAMRPASLKLVIYQQLLDAFRYGVGIIKGGWTIQEFPAMVRVQQPTYDFFGNPIGVEDVMLERDVIAYEGNTWVNVSPFDFFPDPRRPLADFQQGDFVFQRFRRSMTELRQKEAQGVYVGVDNIPRRASGDRDGLGAQNESDAARIIDMPNQSTETPHNDALDFDGSEYVTLHEGIVYCDPSRFGLPGGGATPRRWLFTIANGTRVIRAEAAQEPSYRFGFEVYECSYDWHAPANHGLIEMCRGLQYYYSWLFNSRMAAVRRTLNNELVVDPDMIEELDLLDPEPGRLLRLKRHHWGEGMIDKAVFPIPVSDTTQNHLSGDAAIVQDLIQTMLGVSNMSMGMPNPGRRAATEVQGQMKMAAGRQQLLLEIYAEQSLKPMAYTMTRNTQAFLDLSQEIQLPEPYRTALGAPYVQITPNDLTGNFQFPFMGNGMPTDQMFEASTWKEMLMGFAQNPAILGMLPKQTIPAMAARLLRAMNVRDYQTFGITPKMLTVEPDEQIDEQVRQGNLVPTQDPAMNGTQYGGTGQTGGPTSDGFMLPPGAGIPGGGAMGHA